MNRQRLLMHGKPWTRGDRWRRWGAEAALWSKGARKPKKIVVAVPHGAGDSIALLNKEADEVVVLETPVFYGAVGAFYESFPQVEDDEVTTIMKEFET